MAKTVSFKVYMSTEDEDSDVEVRRFGIDFDVVTNFLYLREKIQNVFPTLRGRRFTIYWKDFDGDKVIISSDEEWGIALEETSVNDIRKLHVTLHPEYKSNEDMRQANNAGPTHAGVVCDGCEKPVQGFRYKCIQCPDYDLCLECESQGLHPEHCMIRLAVPMMWKSHYGRHLSNRINRFLKKAQAHSNKEEERKQCPYKSGRPHGKPRHTENGPSWLDTFATYLDEWANLPGECPMKERAEEAKEAKEPASKSAKPKSPCLAEHIKLLQDGIPLAENFIGSLLEPLINAQAQTDKPETPAASTSTPRDKESPAQNPKEPVQSPRFPGEGKKLSDVAVEPVTAAVTVVPSSSTEKVSTENEGWELLNKSDSPAPSISSSTTSTGAVPKQIQPSAPIQLSPTAQPFYPVLPSALEAEIEQPKPTTEKVEQPQKKIEKPIYHTNPKIQQAVESMIQMGFTNDGGWLTNLLISQDGDITAALDVLAPVRR